VSETVLAGGDVNVVVRVGGTVRRPVGPWSPGVHALLRHFEAAGFDGAPRFLGIDDEGREVLSYVEGEAALAPAPSDDDVLGQLGHLLRRSHDAQRGFERAGDAAWQAFPGDPCVGEVVCHNDLFWPNVVFRGVRPVALIDWDLATPGPRLADVASAASHWVPLRTDEQAREWGLPTNRRRERLRLLCDSYGLDAAERARVVDVVLERRRFGYDAHRIWGGLERRKGWAEMWDAGSGERMLANTRWVERHRAKIESWLR